MLADSCDELGLSPGLVIGVPCSVHTSILGYSSISSGGYVVVVFFWGVVGPSTGSLVGLVGGAMV